MANKKSEETKERIIEVAVQIFARKGYANSGMRELAEKAGVNLAMINYFFGSKKQLLIVILEKFFSGYLKILEDIVAGDGEFEEKIESFIHTAIRYIDENRDYMIVTLTEMPHDDPEIIQYKARWAGRAMKIIQAEICGPLQEKRGIEISPAAIGPLLIGMMSSRFLFAPVMEQVGAPGYGEEFFRSYPKIIADIFLRGLTGLGGSAESLITGGSGEQDNINIS